MVYKQSQIMANDSRMLAARPRRFRLRFHPHRDTFFQLPWAELENLDSSTIGMLVMLVRST